GSVKTAVGKAEKRIYANSSIVKATVEAKESRRSFCRVPTGIASVRWWGQLVFSYRTKFRNKLGSLSRVKRWRNQLSRLQKSFRNGISQAFTFLSQQEAAA